jgi:plastocyanin
VSSCGSSSSAPSSSPIPAGPTTVLAPNGAYLGPGSGFQPPTLTVTAGTTVTFGNNDVTTHTSVADGGAWSSGNISPGTMFSVTLNTKGTFTYHCTIHPFMNGTVVVQ